MFVCARAHACVCVYAGACVCVCVSGSLCEHAIDIANRQMSCAKEAKKSKALLTNTTQDNQAHDKKIGLTQHKKKGKMKRQELRAMSHKIP